MVEAGDRVKVTDFGIAKVTDSGDHLTMTGSLLGTPSYMSPEQAARRRHRRAQRPLRGGLRALRDARRARRPSAGETITGLIFKIITEEPPPLRELAHDVPEAMRAHHQEGAVQGARHALPERTRAGRRPAGPDPARTRPPRSARPRPRRSRPPARCRPPGAAHHRRPAHRRGEVGHAGVAAHAGRSAAAAHGPPWARALPRARRPAATAGPPRERAAAARA